MTGAYAMDRPWLWWVRACAGERRNERAGGRRQERHCDDWFAAMSGRRGGFGPHAYGPWAPFAGQPPFGPPWGRGWRGPKARRGDVRSAILSVLSDASLNGYQIIQQIADRSDGAWKPSPGSIYPTLQQLEDEGLVRAESADGKRVYHLTDEGRAYVAQHAEEVSSPWQTRSDAEGGEDALKPLIGQIAAAIWQIAAVGTPQQQARGREALVELRRKLHVILAEPDQSTDESTDEAQ
ncbi:MAG TPA: PadR family transcriptional regulator [Microlunatus sp.]|nr:PadR family transcriptional regulator [Microlunatus sp.]